MKKIGIITHYYQSKNIGGLLQSYALTCVLNKCPYNVEQVSFNLHFYDEKAQKTRKQIRQVTLKKIIIFCFGFLKNIYKRIINNYPKYSIINKQNDIFLDFENFIPHSVQIYNNLNIIQANKNYDIFVIGSDQVFASYLLPLAAYFGDFTTPDKKVIAYAASSDRKKFYSRIEKLFLQKLQRFNAISVREKTLKEYIESITDKKVSVVLDPTFLLSVEEWLKISNPKVVPNKKYIFCYFLGGKASWQRKMAQAYADKYGYEVIHLPYIMRNIRSSDKYLKGQGMYDVGPREFISLINNAECVFTDSFHGMAFSINFNKNFYVFNRDDQVGSLSMNVRITDMLNMLNLSSRYIVDRKALLNNTSINYMQVNEILREEKEKSIKWLLDALI